jgi:hypothetical protein
MSLTSKNFFPLSGLGSTVTPPSPFNVGLRGPPAEDVSDFVRSVYDLRTLLRGESGYEMEVAEEIRRKIPDFKARGKFVPLEILARGGNGDLALRDVTAATAPGFIQTQRLPRVADALRPVSAVISSGATLLTELSDNLSWPRWQTPSSPAALAETAAIPSSTATTSLMTLSAHRISSMTVISKQLLAQTANMELEQLIKLEMLRSIGSVIDLYCLAGTGVAPQPLGILSMPRNTAGLRDLGKLQPAIAFGGPATWTELVSFVGALEGTDIADDGTMGWITSPATKQKWSSSAKVAGYPAFLYENGRVGDHPLRASNNLSATHQCVFGRWSDLCIGLWPLSVLVDPISQALNANTRIFLDIFLDVSVLHGPGICCSADSAAQ